MVKRKMPRWSELKDLLRIRIPALGAAARMRKAASIWDLRRVARRRTPRAVFDYTDGAAESEISLRRSRALFAQIEFYPGVLRDVSAVDPSTTLLGVKSSYPLGFAPTGFTRMMNHEGEPAVARTAADFGIPYALSTLGTTSPEDVARAAPTGDKWFQLYLMRDRSVSLDLLHRAHDVGFRVMVLTVDTPVGGHRMRDTRNGLTIPPELTVKTIADGAIHPSWWINLLTTEPLRFASLDSSEGTVAELIDRLFDPTITFDDLAWLRGEWDGPLVIKGIQTVPDAERVAELGADGIIVSNHGGRQLDRAPVPLEQLPAIVDAVGDRCEVYLDGGIMSGGDVVAAVAQGARAVFVGRAYLYGLMAGGEEGVRKAASILTSDIERTMKLLGVASVGDLTPGHVRFRTPDRTSS